MLFGHLLTNTAQIFSDVRTYWSPESVKRVTGKELTGKAANGIIHLINSGSTTLDGTEAAPRREAGDETVLGDNGRGGESVLGGHHLVPGQPGLLQRGGYSSNF